MVTDSRGPATASGLRPLVDRAVADPAAFGAVYDLLVDRIFAFAHRQLGSQAEAEDVTSETFLRALAGLHGFSWRGGGFEAWITRIARNLCLDRLRTKARGARSDAAAANATTTTATDEPGPEQVVLAAESAAWLWRQVGRLPETQREIVLLKYTVGLSNREIAAVTGKTATAVSSLLNRATTQLRKRFGDYAG